MNVFKEWLHLQESVTIKHIDPEEEWEEADQADAVAKMVNIRPDLKPSRPLSKNVSHLYYNQS